MNKNLKFVIFSIRFLLTESPNSLSLFRNMFNSQKLSDATKTTESILHQLIEYQPHRLLSIQKLTPMQVSVRTLPDKNERK